MYQFIHNKNWLFDTMKPAPLLNAVQQQAFTGDEDISMH